MKRRVRVEFEGVIFATLVFVLIIGVFEIRDPDRFASIVPSGRGAVDSVAPESRTDTANDVNCARIESEFASTLDRSRSCIVDADCSLARLECPFECVVSVSTNVLDDVKREEMSFQQACHRCESSCPETLVKWRAACVRQRCIVLDRSIEDLEQETLQLINESG